MVDFNEDPASGAPVVASADDYRAAWRDMQDENKKKKDQKAVAADKNKGKKDSGIGSTLGNFVARAWDAIPSNHELGRAVVRGAAKGLEQTGIAVNEAATALGNVMDPNRASNYAKWFKDTPSPAEKFREMGDAAINKTLGPDPHGVAGFVESAAQFTAGMVGATKFLKGARLLTQAPKLAVAVAGGLADMTVFDPHQARLSNLAQNGPSWMRNPLTAFLAADKEDSNTVARLKAGLEGFMTGYAIERFIAFAKPLKQMRSGKPDDVAAALSELQKASEIQPTGVVTKPRSDGTFELAISNLTGPEAEADWASIRKSGFVTTTEPAKVLTKRESATALKGIGDTGYAYDKPVGESTGATLQKPLELSTEDNAKALKALSESGFADGPTSAAKQLGAADSKATLKRISDTGFAVDVGDGNVKALSDAESAAVLKSIGQSGYADGATSAAKKVTDEEAAAAIKNLTESGYAGGATKETPDVVALNKRDSKRALKSIGDTGFASDMGNATVSLKSGAEYVDTVTAVKAAKEAVGEAEFRRLAREEMDRRGVIPGDVHAEKAAIEQTARDIYNKHTTAAAAAAESAPSPTFDTQAEAEATASSINDTVESQARPRGTVTPEQRQQVLDIAERIKSGVDPADVQRLLDGVDFNFNYWQSPDEVKAVINAVAEAFTEAPHMLRNTARSGAGVSWAETAKLADNLILGMSGDDVAHAFSTMFDTTENLHSYVLAGRLYLNDLGKQIARLSRTAESNPVAMDQLDAALEQMLSIGAEVSGTSSNIGRALNAHKMPIGELLAEVAAKNGKPVATAEVRAAYKQEADALLAELSDLHAKAQAGDAAAATQLKDTQARVQNLLKRAKNDLPTCAT